MCNNNNFSHSQKWLEMISNVSFQKLSFHFQFSIFLWGLSWRCLLQKCTAFFCFNFFALAKICFCTCFSEILHGSRRRMCNKTFCSFISQTSDFRNFYIAFCNFGVQISLFRAKKPLKQQTEALDLKPFFRSVLFHWGSLLNTLNKAIKDQKQNPHQ